MAARYIKSYEADLVTKLDLGEFRREIKADIVELRNTLDKIVDKSEKRLEADRIAAQKRTENVTLENSDLENIHQKPNNKPKHPTKHYDHP